MTLSRLGTIGLKSLKKYTRIYKINILVFENIIEKSV